MRWLLNLIQSYLKSLEPTPEALLRQHLIGLSWSNFENYVANMFHQYGYDRVYRTGRDGPDGGKDVVIEHQDKRYLVQCKHWTQEQVGITLLREFYAVMVENGADGGYFVTMAGYTEPAITYANNKAIRLVSLNTLLYWEQLARQGQMVLSKIEIKDPQAPRCDSGVMKVRKKGPHGSFWGCGEWPECYCKGHQRKVM